MTTQWIEPNAIAAPVKPRAEWPDYRAVWRWHFYAGLFAIPFVMVLSITGSIYLFRPQIEALIDRPFDHLAFTGPRQSADAQIKAALAAVPGSTLNAFELSESEQAAGRVLVDTSAGTQRVYVHPQSLAILKIVDEQNRLMRWIFRIHGELLIGNYGSYIVELAASWTIVLIVSGLWLWWPRQVRGWGGILYPRLQSGSRIFWRDLHAVTGVWISALVLIILFSGLPWAKFWGDYFRSVRQVTHTAVVRQDWVNGAATAAKPRSSDGMHMEHGTHHVGMMMTDFNSVDRIAATVAPLHLPPPVTIEPPSAMGGPWKVKSLTANRPYRVELTADGATGAILSRSGFADKQLLDRMVAVGVAWHEGQLFGLLNQLLGLLAALGLMLLCVSSVILWWRRRSLGVLGAPAPRARPRWSLGLGVIVLLLAVLLPLFGASLVIVRCVETFVLRRIPPIQKWLGLLPVAPG